MIIERSQADINRETEELYEQIKPYLDKGYGVYKSVKIVKNKNSVNTNLAWYKRIVEYVDNIKRLDEVEHGL